MAGHGMWRRALAGMAVLAGMAALAPAASAASIGTPTLALTPTSATAASTANLGTDIKFSPTGGDSVKNLTLSLPPGLIANASVDNGACLKATAPIPACVVGTGTVTATENSLGGASLSLPAEFSLVAPPAPGDLAGLAVSVMAPPSSQYTALGTPAAVVLRGSGDPAGQGLNISFTNIPDTFPVFGVSTSISVDEINGTFNGLRFPASCPATPASFSVSASSYGDSTVRTASAPLSITGCAALPFAPVFKLTAARDSTDHQVKIVTDITQGAGQATPSSVKLTLPTSVLSANLGVISILCTNPTSGTCISVGSATASSPLYPTALSGQAYLTGTPGQLTSPSLTIVFPSPFPITLTGAVDLSTNSTTFTGIPDIPLSDLQVALDGGPKGVFQATCATTTGTASATEVSQNGDKTASPSSTFTVANCTPPAGGGTTAPTNVKPKLSAAHASGLLRGHPTLGFKVAAGKGAPKLRSLTVGLPKGLTFVRQRVHKKLTVTGVSLSGAKIKSVSLSHGKLLITLRSAVAGVTLRIGSAALKESGSLRSKAQHSKVKSLGLTVVVRNAKGKSTTVQSKVTRLGFAP
jgi:hypothetical protein